MADFVDINELSLGTTFGGWYAKNNVMIQRLNALNVANIIGGDGITASPHTAANGGYTLSLSGNVTRDMTFNNVTVNGTLISNFAGDISGTTIILPANTGVTLGNIVYIDATGKVQKALADDECTAEVVGIVTGFTGGNAQVATTGRISGSSIISSFTGTPGATLQKGVVYFLSGGVSGAGTTLEPDVTLYVSKPMLLGLTGDSGLILPYRGFIATEGTVGNTTVIQGVCGSFDGVLSVNGLTASIFEPIPGAASGTQRKQTGHIHAVNAIIYGQSAANPRFTQEMLVDINRIDNAISLNPNNTVFTATNKQKAETSILLDNPNSTNPFSDSLVEKIIEYPRNTVFISTLGISDDIYKLHRIRILSVYGNYQIPANFAITRSYNNIGATNIESVSGLTLGSGTFTQSYIECRMKNYSIMRKINRNLLAGNGAAAGLASENIASLVTEQNFSTPFVTPILRTVPTFPVGITANAGATASTFEGTVTEAGTYPIIYKCPNDIQTHKSLFDHRVYGWNFNSVLMSSTEISGYINTTNTGELFDVNHAGGHTLDSSVLGWNAQAGPIPETLGIILPSVDIQYSVNELSAGNEAFNSNLFSPKSVSQTFNILLELYKFNPTTGATGPIMMISKDLQYNISCNKIEGAEATAQGQS
jgi:hypothetical protein